MPVSLQRFHVLSVDGKAQYGKSGDLAQAKLLGVGAVVVHKLPGVLIQDTQAAEGMPAYFSLIVGASGVVVTVVDGAVPAQPVDKGKEKK
jgi:hypothetical protein